MALFSIHLIELFTLALVLLGIYRVFKAISTEPQLLADMQGVEHTQSDAPVSAAPLIQQDQKKALENQASMPEAPGQNVEKRENACEPRAHSHQSVLNNYIGDFF